MKTNDARTSKTHIRNNILSAVESFDKYFCGKYFMYVFEDDSYIEVFFRKSSFAHLTGVATNLAAKDFYVKSKKRQLATNQFYFDEKHPYDLAKRKVNRLSELKKFIKTDLIICKDVVNEKVSYKFALTDTELVLCLTENRDINTHKIIDKYFIPGSFRVNDDALKKSVNGLFVKYIFMKDNRYKLYDNICYGNKNKIHELPDGIKLEIAENFTS